MVKKGEFVAYAASLGEKDSLYETKLQIIIELAQEIQALQAKVAALEKEKG